MVSKPQTTNSPQTYRFQFPRLCACYQPVETLIRTGLQLRPVRNPDTVSLKDEAPTTSILTALQKKVSLGSPSSENAANMSPKRPCVMSMAALSTSVIPAIASCRCREGHISVITPLAAGADPEANGRRNPAISPSVLSSKLARHLASYRLTSINLPPLAR